MESNFIDGIYNYCDRWCERCTFTSRCRNYDTAGEGLVEGADTNNLAFWESIAESLTHAIQLLHKIAEEQGIDLNQVFTEEEFRQQEEKRSIDEGLIKQNPLFGLARQYQQTARNFCKKKEGFVNHTRQMVDQVHLGITSEEEVTHNVTAIGDCFAVIQWYLFFIEAKLHRAFMGRIDEVEHNDHFRDYDGSAKVAIIAIERSMGAWLQLYQQIPSEEDTALKALALLEKMKLFAKEEFPEAMHFKRPGFDD